MYQLNVFLCFHRINSISKDIILNNRYVSLDFTALISKLRSTKDVNVILSGARPFVKEMHGFQTMNNDNAFALTSFSKPTTSAVSNSTIWLESCYSVFVCPRFRFKGRDVSCRIMQ